MSEYRQPTASELLSESQWLRRMLRDALPEHAIDDVLQETWARALRGVPLSPTALRPWLRTVARRIARAFHIGEGRRKARELPAAQPEGQPGADQVVFRLDLQQRVTAIVRDLPEPYRSTVLLRYYENVSVRELARRFGTTADNIYARLSRARVMIQKQLPDDVRARVPLLVAPASSWAPWLVVAGALCFVGLGAVWWVSDAGVEPGVIAAEAPRTPAPAAAGSPIASEREVVEPGTETQAGRREVVSDLPDPNVVVLEPAKSQALRVLVTPVPVRAELLLEQDDGLSLREPLDARGAASFAEARTGYASTRLTFDGASKYERRWNVESLDEDLVWQLGSSALEVFVYDHDGRPADQAFVWLSEGDLSVRTATGTDGRAWLPFLPGADYQLYASIEVDGVKVMEEVRNVAVGEGETRRAVFGSPDGLPLWRGVLRTSAGEPVLSASPSERGKLVLTHEQSGVLVPVFVDPDGSFEARLAPGEYRVLASPPTFEGAYHRMPNLIVSTRVLASDVVLPGTRVVVTVFGLGDADRDLELSLTHASETKRRHRTVPRADGTLVFDGVESGRWILTGERLAQPREIEIAPEVPWVAVEVTLR